MMSCTVSELTMLFALGSGLLGLFLGFVLTLLFLRGISRSDPR